MKRAAKCVWAELLAVAVMVLCTAGAAFAQATTATIEGTVKDNTDAVLPGVVITATNLGTGISRMATTEDRGYYKIFNLPLGDYELEAKLDGFRPHVRRGFAWRSGSPPWSM